MFTQFGAAAAQRKLNLLAASGSAAVVQTSEVRAELVAYAPNGIGKGRTLALGLLLQHQPGWHTYWQNPGDSGLATELEWNLPAGLRAGPVEWPTPHKITVGRLANFGYEGTVLLPVAVTLGKALEARPQADALVLGLRASWLACQTTCIPQSGEFTLPVPLHGSTALHGALFDAARAAQVQPLKGTVRAQPDGDSLLLSVQGFPAQWQGQAIHVFPQTAQVFSAAASPSATDLVESSTVFDPGSTAYPPAGTQVWQDAVWSARLPFSAQRITSPKQVPMVFSLSGRSFQGVADVKGDWPPAPSAAPAGVALQNDATDANQIPPARQITGSTGPDGGGFWWALAAAFVGGLILNLMPCVFPVLAIKVLGMATSSDAQRRLPRGVIGLAYTAGVVVSMLALGAGLLALRAAGEHLGWGFQLQSPTVVAALAVLFTLIGLNLWGWLEWRALVPQSLAGLQLRHPALDAAWTGALAVAVASPCTAPFMGASLGLALTLPALPAMGIFTALALGLALPFAVLSSLPQLTRRLPRPGAWMEYLRQFMAFPMAATVLWLLWVLGHLGGLDAAVSLAALLGCLVWTLWSLRLRGRARWVFGAVAVLVTLALVKTLGPHVLQTLPSPVTAVDAGQAAPAVADAEMGQWHAWSARRVDDALTSGHPVFVDFTAAWCITCQYNKQTTLSAMEVLQDFAAKRVRLLRADWTQRDPAVTQALETLGRSGVPVYVLYQPGHPPRVLSEILTVSDLRAALRAL